jgi:hypothetical protein
VRRVDLLVARAELDEHPVLDKVVVLDRARALALALEVRDPVGAASAAGAARTGAGTHSFSGSSTWKQTMSPSWISDCVNVSFGFMSSIIPGLISSYRRSGVPGAQRMRSLMYAPRSATLLARLTYVRPTP